LDHNPIADNKNLTEMRLADAEKKFDVRYYPQHKKLLIIFLTQAKLKQVREFRP